VFVVWSWFFEGVCWVVVCAFGQLQVRLSFGYSLSRIARSSWSVIFHAPKESVSLPVFWVIRSIVCVKLSLFFFSRTRASYASSEMEMFLEAITSMCTCKQIKFLLFCAKKERRLLLLVFSSG